MSVVPSNKVDLDCIPLNTLSYQTQADSILAEADTLTKNTESVKNLIRGQYDLQRLKPFIESDSVDMLTMYTTIDGQRINMMRILILKLSSSQYQQDGIYRVSNERFSIQHGTVNYRDVEYFQRLVFEHVCLNKGGEYLYVAPLFSMALNLLKSGFQYLVIHRALTTVPITPQRVRDVMSGTAPKYEDLPDSDDDEQYDDTTVSEKLQNLGIREDCRTAEERLSLLKRCCSENRLIQTIYTLYDSQSGRLALDWNTKSAARTEIKEWCKKLITEIRGETDYPKKTRDELSNHVKTHLKDTNRNTCSFYLPEEISDINHSAYAVTLDDPKKRVGTGFTQWAPWLVIDRDKMMSCLLVAAEVDAVKVQNMNGGGRSRRSRSRRSRSRRSRSRRSRSRRSRSRSRRSRRSK